MDRIFSGDGGDEKSFVSRRASLENPFDLWVIQEIIHETRPEVVVEIGCKFGGTKVWVADLLQTLGGGSVIGVDLRRPVLEPPVKCRICDRR